MKKIICLAIAIAFAAGISAYTVFGTSRASSILSGNVYGTAVQDGAKKAFKTITFNVAMHCESCVKKINENISFEKGVKNLVVSLDKKTVTVTYDPAKTDIATLKKAIEKLGYKVTVVE